MSARAASPAAAVLAEYAAALRFEDLPDRVVELAKLCLIDAVACAAFGRELPWSRILLDQVTAEAPGGPCRLPGLPEVALPLRQAALALGALGHAFELDSLRKPGAGVHPGATVALPALAAAQAAQASGRDLLQAIVAGCEVMFRIGAATLHSPEKRGFHAPGLSGPFGSAVACGRLLGLGPERLVNALGIAGSLAGGLLAFAGTGSGGMVKRLHLGRAAESGVVATELAARGYEGPAAVLDGRFGLLEAFCDERDPALLTAELGDTFEIEKLCLKRYACHVTAQAPVQLLREQMAAHGFTGPDIAGIRVHASDKVVSHHSEAHPTDVMGAQYSVPFALAIAAHFDAGDPKAFLGESLRDPDVRSLAERIEVTECPGRPIRGWGADMAITLVTGAALEGSRSSFPGCPESPLSRDGLFAKFERLCEPMDAQHRAALFGALCNVEKVPDLSRLGL